MTQKLLKFMQLLVSLPSANLESTACLSQVQHRLQSVKIKFKGWTFLKIQKSLKLTFNFVPNWARASIPLFKFSWVKVFSIPDLMLSVQSAVVASGSSGVRLSRMQTAIYIFCDRNIVRFNEIFKIKFCVVPYRLSKLKNIKLRLISSKLKLHFFTAKIFAQSLFNWQS